MKDNAAGRVEVNTCHIITRDKQQIDVRQYVVNISIFEDIYAPFVYCELQVVDFEEMSKALPLIGEEFFLLSFKTTAGKEVRYQFLIYKNDSGSSNDLSTGQAYTLKGVTLEKAFDDAKTVTGAYKGSYGAIAGQIFDDYIKLDTNLEFNYEPTKSVQRFISAHKTPLQCIEYCRRRSISATSEASSPFMFFRNSNGYSFISLNGLYNKAAQESDGVTHVYGATGMDPSAGDLYEIGGKVFKNDIVSLNVVGKYDTMSKINGGAYNSTAFSFDLTTKQYVMRKQFNLKENKDKFQLGNVGEFNTEQFMAPFANTRCAAYFLPVDFSTEIDGTQTDFWPDKIGETIAYANIVTETNIHYKMYGDSNVTAGQVMRIQIPASTSVSKQRKSDKSLTGNYLIVRARHDISLLENATYYISVSAITGTNATTIEGMRDE